MTLKLKRSLIALIFSYSFSSYAALPNYSSAEILARANIKDGFNLPAMSFFNNTSPVINNRGDVAFKLMAFDGDNNQVLWLKKFDDVNGKIVFTAPDMRFMADPSLNDLGQIAFNQFDDGVTDGIFTYDADTGKVTQVVYPENKNIAYYTYPQVLPNGQVFFRGTNQENERTFYRYDGELKSIIAEGTQAYGQKSSYLFKPSLNASGAMSFKRRIGENGQWEEENGDEILLLKPNGPNYDSVTIAKDRDLDSDSVFLGFTNSTSLSNNGQVAFIGIIQDNIKAIILYKDGLLRNLVVEKTEEISEIELFSPKVNDLGQVLFRARDGEGRRGIYLADTDGFKRIIGEGDEVLTDLGMGKILSNPNYPGFGGDVDMNDQGEIVFYCLVVGAKDNKEWGSAVFKISPKK